MSQTTYNLNQGEAFAGMKVDSRFDTVESHLTEVDLDFGLGVMSGYEDAVGQVRLPANIKAVATGSADLITDNSTVATVNGTAMTAVVYGTSHAATMTALAAMIATHPDVLSAAVTAARVITVIGINGVAMTVSLVTTLGLSQATWSVVASDPGAFRGVAIHRHVPKTTADVAKYSAKDSVDVLRRGSIWMPYVSSATPSVDDPLYINLAVAGQEGKATDVSTNNIATGGVIRKVDTVNKLLVADINLP